MAGIDKTYTQSYEDYNKFKEWAMNNSVKFVYGKKKLTIPVQNYLYNHWTESDFNGDSELPIMNSPTWLDKYIKDNCDIDFVLKRLDEVYPNGYLDDIELNYIPKDFKINRKIIITKNDESSIPLTNKGIDSHKSWMLQTYDSSFMFSEPLNSWVHMDSNFPWNTNTMHFKTIKSMVRLLRGMYLPSNLEFTLIGRYVGETFNVRTK